jgi:hypothetical protein
MKATTEAARLSQAIRRAAAKACSMRATPSSNAWRTAAAFHCDRSPKGIEPDHKPGSAHLLHELGRAQLVKCIEQRLAFGNNRVDHQLMTALGEYCLHLITQHVMEEVRTRGCFCQGMSGCRRGLAA